MEPIIVNIATFENFDKRMYRFLMIGLALIIFLLSMVNIRFYLKNRSIIMDYQNRIDRIESDIKEDKGMSGQSANELNETEKENLERHIAFVNTIILHDIFPWPETLDMIEKSILDGIVLERVFHSPSFKTLTIQGVSKSTENVGAFLEALSMQVLFKEVSLSSLSIDSEKSDDIRPQSIINFELSCTLDLKRVFSQEKAEIR